jgi:hypothetical protein
VFDNTGAADALPPTNAIVPTTMMTKERLTALLTHIAFFSRVSYAA